MAKETKKTEKIVFVKALKDLTIQADGLNAKAKQLAKVPMSMGLKLVKEGKAKKHLWD